ncbi:MAG: G8 domain-containing protein [Actinomycetota bacterium]
MLLSLGGYALAQDGHDHADQAHGSSAMPGHDHATHSSAMSLVADELATHRVVADGAWSNPATWGGIVPDDGARVVIPEGFTVTVDGKIADRIETIGVHGTLRFATDVSTELLVDTLVSTPKGTVEIGTAANPIRDDVSARLVFIDDGPIDRSVDPEQLGRGAVLHGATTMFGAETTHRTTLSGEVRAGATEIALGGQLTGWGVGDQIVITGTNGPTSDEVRTIASVNGNTVTFTEPLAVDHVAPRSDLSVYVANITRNIIVESESEEVSRRGHVMFMHTHQVDVNNVRFDHLGRTDKSIPLDDVNFGESAGEGGHMHDGAFELGEANNIRARYSVHVHRGGIDPSSSAAQIRGSVVFDDPGWGFVNHSSNVDFIDNVSYRVQGVGFMTEAGDEVGSMVGNIAIRSVMPGFTPDDGGAIDPDTRSDEQDFGFQGDGFWLQGNRVAVVDNVAAGSSAHGIIFWSEGLVELNGEKTAASNSTIPVATLPNPSLIPDRDQINVWWAPLAEVSNNESYGATVGFRSRYVHGGTYLEDPDMPPQAYVDSLAPVIDGLVVWDVRDGVLLNYNERLSLRNADIIGRGEAFNHNLFATAAIGVGADFGNEITQGPGVIENVRISGFEMGVIAPRNGEWAVQNLQLANVTDLLIHETRNEDGRTLSLDGVTFVPLDGTAVAGRDGERQNVVLQPWFVGAGEDVEAGNFVVAPDRITVDGQRIFFEIQGPDSVPVTIATLDLENEGELEDLEATCAALDGDGGSPRFKLRPDDDEDFDGDADDEDFDDDRDEDFDDDHDDDFDDDHDEDSDSDELDEVVGFVEDHIDLDDFDVEEDLEEVVELIEENFDLDDEDVEAVVELVEEHLFEDFDDEDLDDEDLDEGSDDEDSDEDFDDDDGFDDEGSDEDFDDDEDFDEDSDDEDFDEDSNDEDSDEVFDDDEGFDDEDFDEDFDEDVDEGFDDEDSDEEEGGLGFNEGSLLGCTNEQLVQLFGRPFGGSTVADGAQRAPWLVGGVIGSETPASS